LFEQVPIGAARRPFVDDLTVPVPPSARRRRGSTAALDTDVRRPRKDAVQLLQIRPQLHMVQLQFAQAYLWRDGDELTLIDAGVPGSGPDIAAATTQLGLAPEAIRRVVLTHGHEDHYGAAAEIRSWSGATVYAHAADAAVIRGEVARAEPVLTEFDRPIWEQVSALGVPGVLASSEVDVELADGDELEFGDGAVVLGVPGHTPGSIALHLPQHRVLFTGDTIAAGVDGDVMLGVFNLDEAAMLEGFHRLAALDTDTACFGHGLPVVSDAGSVLRSAAASHQPRQP
jgi:glyoxylase-like metal-dependent hydrolase (beta-lactamase superfamily II)